uniref:non-specific serine/threonine protein kinase n=1 Tax=Panagrellus redivivus TaxID=6233 RepID=A0A7E5A0I1_PANRE
MDLHTPPKKPTEHDEACNANRLRGSPVCICANYQKKALSRYSFTDPATARARKTPQFAHAATVVSFKRPPPQLSVPQLIGSDSYFHQAFKNIREIGRGSFGVVYSATANADGKAYAIKVSNHYYNSSARRDRALEEVRLHEFLPPHKNIVRFIMAWEERDRLYIQLELCKGQDLRQMHSSKNPVNEKQIWKWAEGFAKALKHLHENDVIHLDVKPDNMFIGFDGEVKLGDFGSAVDLINNDLDDFDDGDSRYLAPEVLNDQPCTSSDIYSLGMALLELSSHVDFDRIHFDSSGEMHRAAWDNLKDNNLKELISVMTHEDPTKRPNADGVLQLVRYYNRKYLIKYSLIFLGVALFIYCLCAALYYR